LHFDTAWSVLKKPGAYHSFSLTGTYSVAILPVFCYDNHDYGLKGGTHMKVSDKKKGIVDYTSAPHELPDEFREWDMSDEQLEYLEALDDARVREAEENARARTEWQAQGKKNLEIILYQNYQNGEIAKRLAYLFEEKHIEKTAFARQAGLGRTTIHRYISGDSTPSKKKLLQVLDALSMSVEDFCYEPTNFEAWKEALIESISKKHDIFILKDHIMKELAKNDFTYSHNGETVKLPYRHYTLLKAILESGFKVLDLLPHDKK
jgi:transcriptional regulator with XRE-family HTH domain